ncbi:cyclic nucleotide-binding domain-containing protein 2-like [Actinia tenebrosa]|uniref:Cyclic nucleotide-binding domain-containing protein 2-like n=1 Tax=Actinia tenebrosa TaxID=6105 RepID=A0A6P8J3K4_ACTTE|nr:cyclic nucleotide-binding domain-containing protein 2-like [Actinia tenebrosa]
MEASRVNQLGARESFWTQNQSTDQISNFSNLTDNNNNHAEADAVDAATVHSLNHRRAIRDEDIQIPFALKKLHYSSSTLASESKEKTSLRNRLPDFTLTNNRPVVDINKFIYGSIYDRPRYRRCRGRTFPQHEKQNTNLLTKKSLKRSTSLHNEKYRSLRARINSLNREILSESRIRRRVSKDGMLQEKSRKESTQVSIGRANEGTLDEEEEMEAPFEVKRFKNVDLPIQRRPIERFQKTVRLICFLLKVKSSIDRKYKQPQHSVVFEQLEEITESGISSDDGIVFDPNYFKAIREVKLSPDSVQILSMLPGTRTEEQIQAALVGLKTAVAAFGEYPLKMQRRLVNVGWYESFEAKRVIIRQGHRAENFYFILSGTALVTLLVNDPATGEERSTTIAVLGKGSSFGELALLHHKTRSATVLCKNEVALLAVGREDFRDIFMSYEDGKEPDHVQFLRTIPYLMDLPLEQCVTRHDICIFHYFRRGVVIVKNSNTEWIYILKSGSCRVLTNLAKRRSSTSSCRGDQNILNLPAIPVNEFERRKLLYTACGERSTRTAWSIADKRPRTEPQTHKEKADLSLPAITSDNEKFKVIRIYLINYWKNLKKDKDSEKLDHVCVQIELLKPKDQFGLASILYDRNSVKCHLVSNGAECILIKKSWFLQNTNEDMRRDLRAQFPAYPTQQTLEQNLQDKADWESFKNQTISDLLDTLHL